MHTTLTPTLFSASSECRVLKSSHSRSATPNRTAKSPGSSRRSKSPGAGRTRGLTHMTEIVWTLYGCWKMDGEGEGEATNPRFLTAVPNLTPQADTPSTCRPVSLQSNPQVRAVKASRCVCFMKHLSYSGVNTEEERSHSRSSQQ